MGSVNLVSALIIWLALVGTILPIGLYGVWVVVGLRRKKEPPYFAPAAILLAMAVSVAFAMDSSEGAAVLSVDLTSIFTNAYVWLALAGAILPIALYVACVVVGLEGETERPYFAPTGVLLAMIVSVALGGRDWPVGGGWPSEGWLVFSWHVELLASAGLLVLLFLRRGPSHAPKVQFALTDLICCVGAIGGLMAIQFGTINEWSPPLWVLVLWAILIPLLGLAGCSLRAKWMYPLVCVVAVALRSLVPSVGSQSWEHAAFLAACILCTIGAAFWFPPVEKRIAKPNGPWPV